jgi:hypothetical protein
MNAVKPIVIYPAQSIMTLLSRAWNLFRSNFKSSILIILPSVLMTTVIHLISSLLSSSTFLTPTTPLSLGLKLVVLGITLVLMIPNFFVGIFTCSALSRFYYSAILGETPLGVKACWSYVLKHWLKFTLLAVALGSIFTVLIVINILILYLGIFLSVAVMTALGVSVSHFASNVLAPGIMLVLFLLIWGFTILAVVISMMAFQVFFFAFPMLAFATAPTGQVRWWPLIHHAYQLLFENITRLILFSVALFFLSLAMVSVIMSPAWIWTAMEFARLGLSQQYHIPMHIQAVLNIWGSLGNLIIIPFNVSALTLLWYDCLVRKEGLDLKLWFNHLIRRQGHTPEAFNTAVDPQPA